MPEDRGIDYYSESIDFTLKQSEEVSRWLLDTCQANLKSVAFIDYIFCSDEYLLEINKQYLNHDTYTDIITFPLGQDPIQANIFISIDRVKENAETYKQDFNDELHRVMVHGVLHLVGYGDKSEKEKEIMHEKENHFLKKRNFL